MSPVGPLFLGVDGGGTSTVTWLGTTGGVVIGRGRAGPSNAKAVGAASAHEALTRSIAGAFSDAGIEPCPVASVCLGLAGFDRPEDKRLLTRWVDQAAWMGPALFVNDGDLVVAAGTPEGWGIGVIAGTGSIVVGRGPDGRTTRAGGWGHLIGDEGSAYRIALDALRIVVRRHDGRDPRPAGADPLTDRLCRALGVEGPVGIVSALYAPEFDRARIAGLAPEVIAAAGDDPDVARALFVPAGLALAEQATAVARALSWPPGPVPLALAGSFLLGTPVIVDTLVEGLERSGFATTATAVPEPVKGALALAERAVAGWAGPF